MKLIITITFLMSTAFAQNDLTVILGLNQSNYTYNDDDWVDNTDIDYITGFNLAVEKPFGSLVFGAGLNQRGVKLSAELQGYGYSVDIEGEEKINYLTLHSIYPISLQSGLSAFGGLQLGKGLGGEMSMKMSGGGASDDESEDIDSDEIAIDYGVLLGIEYMINEQIGVRGAYFKGLSDVSEEAVDDENFKSNTISISLTYKL